MDETNFMKRKLFGRMIVMACFLIAAAGFESASAAGPQPGIYQLRSLGSDWCVGFRPGGGPRLPYLATGDCTKLYERSPGSVAVPLIFLGIPVAVGGSEVLGYSPIAIVPHPRGGVTLRSVPPYYARMDGTPNGANRLLSCVTVARNVVIGPPGIDIWPCDADSSQPWSQAGGADQRFVLTAAPGDGNYTITQFVADDNGRRTNCIDVRGASTNINTDLIEWECNHQQNQIFHLTYLGPLTTRDDIATAQSQTPAAILSSTALIPAVASRVTWQRGVNLPGTDMPNSGHDTLNDGGNACSQMCLANRSCVAFSWVKPSVQGPAAKCWLKNGVPTGNPDANVNSGTVSH